MKIVDNRHKLAEEKEAGLGFIRKTQALFESERQRLLDKKSRTVSVMYDWRTASELDPLIGEHMPGHLKKQIKRDFINYALANRTNLNELLIEPCDPNQNDYEHNRFEFEWSREEYDSFAKVARKVGLSVDEYAVAIVHTIAKQRNDERKRQVKMREEERIRNTPLSFEGKISKDLAQKLKVKYHTPYPDPNIERLISFDYGTALAKVAEEYFAQNK